ncbi:SRPBCC domain-containing protein [Streptosporangium amethystogenes]|uniref:SRPBCC domain-containing protein n=1 Tax=Streptosporangium amethystogenes TaxID=2002 RepID=UPI0037B292FE
MTEQPPAKIGKDGIGFDWALERDPGAVWAALSTEEVVSRWLDCKAAVDPVPGGKVRFDWGDEGMTEGVVTDVEPGRILEYSWDETAEEASRVRWEVEAAGGGSRLRLTHSGLNRPQKAVKELAAGWHDFLDALVAELSGTPHTSRHDELLERYAKS